MKIKERLLMGIGVALWFVCIFFVMVGIVSLVKEKTTNIETTTETEPELYGVVDHEFIEIVAWDEKDLTGIAYDSDTKIIYMFTTVDGARLYTPYYVMNEDNKPVIGVYDDTEEEYEFEDTVGEIGGEITNE